ncbi:MAG TPA: sulfotransferase [Oceanospirillales bacterium]|nr:sulfotransferase [Oceanospirillales bacterium]
MKLLFIIGMQKSGTSLFNRMLMRQDCLCNPFLPEGKFFWGDNPPFTPTDQPCGVLYQKHKGDHGHYLDDTDATDEDRLLLLSRIKQADIKEPILMNKNPYNSVRIKWLKTLFPQGKIIAIYRNPVANIYSLLKRYNKQNQGVGPENGWWGIKPRHWQNMLSDNKISQCIQQWNAVNQEILNNVQLLDMLVNYDDLCSDPNAIIQQSIHAFGSYHLSDRFQNIKNMNGEYLTGSRLMSKNKELKRQQGFDLSQLQEVIEFPALAETAVALIKNKTTDVYRQLKQSSKNFNS